MTRFLTDLSGDGYSTTMNTEAKYVAERAEARKALAAESDATWVRLAILEDMGTVEPKTVTNPMQPGAMLRRQAE